MNLNSTMSAVEYHADRTLEAYDEQILRAGDADMEVREEIQLIDILDEMTTVEEATLMNRLLMGRKNAAVEIHELLKAVLERAVEAQVAVILRGGK